MSNIWHDINPARIQPEDFIIRQINNKGEYVRGWLNFADKDKYRA